MNEPVNDQTDNFFELSLDLLSIINADGTFARINKAWVDTLGWSKEEILTKPFINFVHEEDRQRTLDEWHLILEKGHSAVRFTNRYRCRDGSYKWLEWHTKIDENRQKNYSVTRDVTEERLAFQDLVLKEQHVREILNALPQHAWFTKPDGTPIFHSKTLIEFFQLPADYLLQSDNWVHLIHPDDLPKSNEAWMRSLATGEPYMAEIRFKLPDGSYRWFLGRSLPLKDASGSIKGWVGTNTDIDDLKAAHQTIEAQNLTIVEKARLAALGEMSAGIAHEINNPLSIITGLASQLRRMVLSGQLDTNRMEAAVDKIEKSGFRIARIVSGLRVFGRDASGDSKENTSVKSVIDDVISISQARIRNNGITFVLPTFSDVFMVRANGVQIGQVLINLLNNAFDSVMSCANEEKKIELRAECSDGWLSLSVIDNGPGVDPNLIDKVFLPFFTTKPIGKGVGLGLSISMGIARDHGGRMELDSKPGQTKFSMIIPLADEQAEQSQ